MNNQGEFHERINHNPMEKAFAEKWEEMNDLKRNQNARSAALDHYEECKAALEKAEEALRLKDLQETAAREMLEQCDELRRKAETERDAAEQASAAQRDWINATVDNCSVFCDPPTVKGGEDYIHRSEVEKLRRELDETRRMWQETIGKNYVRREMVQPLVEALDHIYAYPVYSEPLGGAMDMQDIALKALAQWKEGK